MSSKEWYNCKNYEPSDLPFLHSSMRSSMPSFMYLHRLDADGPSEINTVCSGLGDTDDMVDVGSCKDVAVADCGNDAVDGGSGVADGDSEVTGVRSGVRDANVCADRTG